MYGQHQARESEYREKCFRRYNTFYALISLSILFISERTDTIPAACHQELGGRRLSVAEHMEEEFLDIDYLKKTENTRNTFADLEVAEATAHQISHDPWYQVGFVLITGVNSAYVLGYSGIVMVPLGWVPGVLGFVASAAISLYANNILARLHETGGKRRIRYRDLAGHIYGIGTHRRVRGTMEGHLDIDSPQNIQTAGNTFEDLEASKRTAHLISHDPWYQVGFVLITGVNSAYVLGYSGIIMVPLGWVAGVLGFVASAAISLYANYILARLHETGSKRHIRYRDLAGHIYGTHPAAFLTVMEPWLGPRTMAAAL